MNFPIELPRDRQFDAVGFGLNAVDHLIVVPEYPAFDTKVRLLEHKQSAGGQTASTMVALRRLGLKTAYAGRFGSDPEGQFGLKSLIGDDVNCDFAEVIEDAKNQIAFITIDARSGERTIVWDRDERLAYKPDEAPAEFGECCISMRTIRLRVALWPEPRKPRARSSPRISITFTKVFRNYSRSSTF
jgi:sugar/nucleoside kinase (ribokinase family)